MGMDDAYKMINQMGAGRKGDYYGRVQGSYK